MRRLLVANRGEIACRIIRTARALGLETVAVFSEADAGAPHTRAATWALPIGPAPAAESYLDGQRLLAAARDSGADALHPGYGFLSENAAFAEAVITAGLTWVGPPAQAIAAMGDKAEAKRRMRAAGVPCIPGYEGEDQSDAALMAAAREIGTPLMVKAAAGGGGKGMRRVERLEDLPEALARARSEAERAFGSPALILERALERPRHIEVQVLADAAGACVHLFERDCSVQRRHQKVLEEAPAPGLSQAERAEMGAAAVRAAQAIGYVSAGTVEFLRDASGAFYFMEMNTRLQVEHPVTEMVTGQDLVALQLRIAEGCPLPFAQGDLALSGHAIEARLYAEDTARGFLPAAGRLALWQPPEGAGVRVDHGLASGLEITPHYDPMLAKIIAHGPDRETARQRLLAALTRTAALGLPTNRDFLIALAQHPEFTAGRATTALVEEAFPEGFAPPPPGSEERREAALVWRAAMQAQALAAAPPVPAELLGWSSSGHSMARVPFAEEPMLLAEPTPAPQHPHALTAEALHLVIGPHTRTLPLERHDAAAEADPARIAAPMAGTLTALRARPGDRVEAGQPLAVIEAMKMQHTLRAEVAGSVAEAPLAPGAQVARGALVVRLEPLEEEERGEDATG